MIDRTKGALMKRKMVLLNSCLMGALFVCTGGERLGDHTTFAQSINRTAINRSAPQGETRSSSLQRVTYPVRTRGELEFLALRARARVYEPFMLQAARRHGVDPRALWAIAYMETRFRPTLVSEKGARGMMQFMPATAARFGLLNPYDPVAAIDAAARYVRVLTQKFAGNPALVLAAYNAGEGAVESYLRGVPLRLPDGKVINPRGQQTGGVPQYTETKRYVTGGLSVMRLVSSLGVFTLPQIAACGFSLALPVIPRGNAIAYPSRRAKNSPTDETEARAASVENVMETVPEPVSIYAVGMNRTVGAPQPSVSVAAGKVLTLEKVPPGKSDSNSTADADRLVLPTSSYSFGATSARTP